MAGLGNEMILRINGLIERGRLDEAEKQLLSFIARKPDAEACSLLAYVSFQRGEREKAVYHAARSAALAPNDPELAARHSDLLATTGRAADAIKADQAAIARIGRHPRLLTSLAEALIVAGRPEEALTAAEESLAAGGDALENHVAAAKALEALGRDEESLERLERAEAFQALHDACMKANDYARGMRWARRAIEVLPGEATAWWNYASLLNYSDEPTPQQLFQAHQSLGRVLVAGVKTDPPQWRADPDPDRALRIGLISPDLRQHAVISFLRPLLEGYDRSRWHVTAYSMCGKEDRVSEELRGLVDQWRHLPGAHPAEVVRVVRGDRIDVAFDLAGYSLGQPMPAFAARCAPVQINYLGYANTSGLATMDARVVDSHTDPAGAESLATERLLRIDPCFLCYSPLVAAPDPYRAPDAGPVVFGSFNFSWKITPTAVRMWSAAVKAVPASRLVLKSTSLKQPGACREMIERFEAQGVAPGVVSILPPTPGFREHLESYQHFDIALDPYPYHGTTTTCEAMWMGVPTITLAGDRHLARVGVSLLNAVRLGDLVARSESEFVEIVRRLAADKARVTAWRSPGPGGLRAVMLASPLCDQKAFCVRFQGAVREAWRDWCRGRATSG